MNLGEYAAHRLERGLRGVTKPAVLEAIRSGRLSKAAARKVGNRWRIDPVLADAQWEANTDHRHAPIADRQRRAATGKRHGGPGDPPLPPGVPALFTSKAIREAYQAKLAAVEYEEKIGKLVEAAQVRAALFGQLRALRDAILNVEPKVLDELAAIAGGLDADQRRRAQQLLQRELRQVCDQAGQVNMEGQRNGDLS